MWTGLFEILQTIFFCLLSWHCKSFKKYSKIDKIVSKRYYGGQLSFTVDQSTVQLAQKLKVGPCCFKCIVILLIYFLNCP